MGLQKIRSLCVLVAALTSLDQPIASGPPAETNEEYIVTVSRRDPRLRSMLADGRRRLAEYISNRLARLDHLNPEGYPEEYFTKASVMNTPTAGDLMRFDEQSLIVTYHLLHALSDYGFRRRIGQELELDTPDRSGEHGGVFHVAQNGTVHIEMLPNTFSCGQVEMNPHHCRSDSNYAPANPTYTLDILADFHFHAQNVDHRDSAALSGNDFFSGAVFGTLTVFTRVGEHRFNADVGLYYQDGNERHSVNLDLGVYGY